MDKRIVRKLAFALLAFWPAHLCAQNPQQLYVLQGTALASGLDIGINTSGGITNWLTAEPPPPAPGDLKMVCPPAQAWCAMFTTYGPSINPPRPGIDLSNYQSLTVTIEGDPGTTIQVGIKDATQPDDGTETKVSLPVTSTWTTFAIPLSSFVGANIKDAYVLCEFVFPGGPQAQTLRVQNVTYTTAVAPQASVVESAASFAAGVGANTWVSVFGLNLSATTRGWESADFVQNKLPTALNGTGVSLNGQPMAVSFVSPGQINALILSNVPSGAGYLSVTSALGNSVPIPVNVHPLFPGLFTLPAPNAKYAAAVASSDGAYIAPPGSLGAGVNARAAKPGETIELYGTGFGPTNPEDTPGVLLSTPLPLVAPVDVLFGEVPSPSVSFAGLTMSGLYQFNVVVPNVAAGDQPIVVNVAGNTSQANVFVPVSRGS